MSKERLLSGPTVPPKAGGAPKQLVVMLHGVGADGNDLINLAPYYQSVLPAAYVISPHAPFPFDMAPFGYMWFSIGDMNLETRLNGVRVAAPRLDAFLDAELARHELTDADLLLMGFSQGAMMALHVGLRRARPPAGIIAHSGMLVVDHRFAAEIRGRPPVLLTHGANDEVLPPACLPAAEAVLKMAGVPVESHLIPNLGHGIDETTLRLDLTFLRARFPAQS
jgi:phospholipase/carboxylesterase